jgi:GNAT superfamily N-acetyltransferase
VSGGGSAGAGLGRDIEIRPGVAADIPALSQIYLDSRKQAFSWVAAAALRLDDFQRDTAGEAIWVAADATGPVGFASVYVPDNFIHNLFVHPQRTGQGIGTALLSTCIQNLGRPAVLKCVARNVRAREFYLARGWQIAAHGRSPDGRYLRLHLDAPA